MPKLSRASCGATKTSAEFSSAILASSVIGAEIAAPGWQRSASLAGDDHLEIGSSLSDQRNCGQQYVEAFARFVEPTDEDQSRLLGCRSDPADVP